MKRALAFLLLAFPALAADGPKEIVARVLASDFAGERAGRFGLVHYTTSPPDQRWGPRPGFLLLEGSTLDVAAETRIETVRIDGATAEVTVRARVCATSEGINPPGPPSADGRRFLPLATPEWHERLYHLESGPTGWIIIDPPPPLVSRAALLAALRPRLAGAASEEAQRQAQGSGHGNALAAARARLRDEVRVLERLAC